MANMPNREKPESETEKSMSKVEGLRAGKGSGMKVKTTHTVKSGETLSDIALKHYGNVAKWKTIYETNKAVIGDDYNLIKPGQELKIPED